MQTKIGAVAFLLVLSLHADASPARMAARQDQPVCGACLELDNEILPDKHYFPAKEELVGSGGAPMSPVVHDDPLTLSAQVWSTDGSHSTRTAAAESAVTGNRARARSDWKHGEPSREPADFDDTEWAWGGIRECSRGPEGKIAAGCHTATYDNLLCNSHYDECDNELFALAVSAVKNADVKALRELIQNSGHATVLLNVKRSAIQLVGCTGDIVGNLPIEQSFLRALK